MWKLKRIKFFMKRLADLERVLQQEERLEEVNITRVEMCENLMQKMAVEEQEAMEECKMAAKQRVRWADVEEGQKGEKEENWRDGGRKRTDGRRGCGGRSISVSWRGIGVAWGKQRMVSSGGKSGNGRACVQSLVLDIHRSNKGSNIVKRN